MPEEENDDNNIRALLLRFENYTLHLIDISDRMNNSFTLVKQSVERMEVVIYFNTFFIILTFIVLILLFLASSVDIHLHLTNFNNAMVLTLA
jgi:hypothetical protein